MRFQVGKFTAEFKLGDSGQLQVLWSPYRPCYLNRGEREQYRAARAAAARDALLRATGKPPARLGAPSSWRALQRLAPALLLLGPH